MSIEEIALIIGGVGFIIFIICVIMAMVIGSRNSKGHQANMQNHNPRPSREDVRPVRAISVNQAQGPFKFSITRQEIVAYAKVQDPENVTAKDTLDPQFPYSIKWKTKIYLYALRHRQRRVNDCAYP